MVRRVYVVDRKKLGIVSVLMVLAIAGVVMWRVSGRLPNQMAFSQGDVPEVSITSISLSPKTVTRDLTYEGIPFQSQQLFKGREFTAVVSFKNTSTKTMKDIPVEASLYIEGKDPVTKSAKIHEMAPGSSVTLDIGKFPILGDAKGKSANAGLHQLQVQVLANPTGGVEMANEQSILFFVDSKAK